MPRIANKSIITRISFRIMTGAILSYLIGSPPLPVMASEALTDSETGSQLIVYAEHNEVDNRIVVTLDGTSIQGHASELVRALLKRTGHTADIRVVPWARLMHHLESEPNVLALNMTRTPEREEHFYWIGDIRPVSFKLWGLRDRIDQLPKTLDQARNFRISSYRNDVVEQHLLSKGFTKLIYVRDNYNSIGMLKRGRIDLASFSELEMGAIISKSRDLKETLAPIIGLEDISTAQYLVLSKNSDPKLAQSLTEAFAALVASGEYYSILGDSLGSE